MGENSMRQSPFSDISDDSLIECTPPKLKNTGFNNYLQKPEDVEEQVMEREWGGVPLENLKISNLNVMYPPVKPSHSHSVLFKLPVKPNQIPSPYPEKSIDIWHKDFIRLPCSSNCLSPVSKNELRKRWDLIQEAFSKPIKSSHDLETAILHYNSKYVDRWSFVTLHHFFSRTLQEEETEYFFSNLFPSIVELALSLPQIVTAGIPLLRQKKTHSLSLTQKQIACLLANAFLCTFPRRNTSKSSSEYNNFPDINFNRLYSVPYGVNVQEKLKCIINYFRRVCTNCPDGVVTYSRHYVSPNKLPIWSESDSLFTKLHVNSIGSIEGNGNNMMQLDFANKLIGGGVLGRGCVQEEIRFVICPELIIARLFTECLDDTESLIVTGVERFNQYEGYGQSFTWKGDYKDETPRDIFSRRLCILVAVDAFNFHHVQKQYTPYSINRELNKAYAGFSWGISQETNQPKLSVATGNWGCGAFGGDVYLKALLQLMVAGQTGRNVAYFTFNNRSLQRKLKDIHEFLTNYKITIGSLLRLLYRYQNECDSSKSDLYDYLQHVITTKGPEKFQNDSKNLEKQCNNSTNSKDSFFKVEETESRLTNAEDDGRFDNVANKSDKQSAIGDCNSSRSEPVEAKSYSVKSKEGLDICLKRQRDSWARIEESKKDFNNFVIVDDDSVSSVNEDKGSQAISNSESKLNQKTVVKRKISDYFISTPKV